MSNEELAFIVVGILSNFGVPLRFLGQFAQTVVSNLFSDENREIIECVVIKSYYITLGQWRFVLISIVLSCM